VSEDLFTLWKRFITKKKEAVSFDHQRRCTESAEKNTTRNLFTCSMRLPWKGL